MTRACKFVETPAAGGSHRCDNEPVYKVWIDGCRDCGAHLGIAGIECVGHWACIGHGAEVRAGQLITPDGGDMTVRRIQSAQ